MGDPKKKKKKYQTPSHPWGKERVEEEKKIIKEYGFKNRKEIWKMKSILINFINQTRKLIADTTKQGEKEKIQLLHKLYSLGLITKTSKLEDILSLTPKDIMERRLQTLVFRKGLAKSINQARQFIVHGHVNIGNKKITSPSYLVVREEESKIGFLPSSQLSSAGHPERSIQKKEIKKKKK